jgi:hypothetical protein
MAFKPVFKFRNPDSTFDLNSAYSSAIAKGIYSGGDVTVSGLNITIAPFTAVGFDGLVVKSDTPITVTAVNGKINVVALFAKYERDAKSAIQLNVFEEATLTGSSLADYYVIFGKTDLTAGGYTSLLVESSSPPPGVGVFSFSNSHYADKVGVGLKQPSASFSSLPYTKNRAGDVRYALAEQSIYAWNATTKTWLNILATTAGNVTYAGGNAWVDGVSNPATTVEGQLDKILTELGAGGSGASKISTSAFVSAPLDIPSNISVQAVLQNLVTGVNARGVLAGSNTWSGINNTFQVGAPGPARTFQVDSETINIGNTSGTSATTFRGTTLVTSTGTLAINAPTTVTASFTSTGGATFSNTISMSTLNVSNLTTSGVAYLTGGVNLQEIAITPAIINSGQVTYSPPSFQDASVVRISSNNTHSIRSILYTAATHKRKTFINVGSYPIIFNHEYTSSTTAVNRIITNDGFDFTLNPGSSIVLLYDDDVTTARWRVLSKYKGEAISSVSLSTNQTAWSPTNWSTASVISVNPSVNNLVISGLDANVVVLRKLIINAAATRSLIISHSTTPGTGILCPLNATFTLGPQSSVEVFRDTTSGFWRLTVASANYVFQPTLVSGGVGSTGITAYGSPTGTNALGARIQALSGNSTGAVVIGGPTGTGIKVGGGGLTSADTTGTASGEGIIAWGAGTSTGIISIGGNNNGIGIVGIGKGSGTGGSFTGGDAAYGIEASGVSGGLFTGGDGGYGIEASGSIGGSFTATDSSGSGVIGIGAIGGDFTGNMSGRGVRGTGGIGGEFNSTDTAPNAVALVAYSPAGSGSAAIYASTIHSNTHAAKFETVFSDPGAGALELKTSHSSHLALFCKRLSTAGGYGIVINDTNNGSPALSLGVNSGTILVPTPGAIWFDGTKFKVCISTSPSLIIKEINLV